jgi:hypothetical protein
METETWTWRHGNVDTHEHGNMDREMDTWTWRMEYSLPAPQYYDLLAAAPPK